MERDELDGLSNQILTDALYYYARELCQSFKKGDITVEEFNKKVTVFDTLIDELYVEVDRPGTGMWLNFLNK